MLPRFRPLIALICALCYWSSPAAPAHAYPPSNLAEAIKRGGDSDRRRIPLLLVNPEQVSSFWDGASHQRLYELYREENANPPLSAVLPLFQRQIIPCASVHVIAPLKRVSINPYPGPPEEWARIGRERAAKLLFTSLSPAQWVAASAPNGLGISDLRKEEQRSWFLSLIPEPFVLTEATAGENGSITFSHTAGGGGVKTVTVTPEQVRLRVVRAMSWYYRLGPNSGYTGYGDSENANRQPGDRYWTQTFSEAQQPPAESYVSRLKDAVRIEKPNRLVKGDLSFNDAPLFGKTIRLGGAKTLGDLVQRVAEATGLELYADRRLTGLSVIRIGGGESAAADAADVMKALCLATTGTIRKVTDPGTGASVFLLAGDRQPLMHDRLRLAEWAGEVNALLNAEQTTFQKTVTQSGVVGGVGFAENAVGRIGDDLMRAAEERITDPDRYRKYNNDHGFVPIPVSALPSAGQEKVRRDLEQSREHSSESGPPLDEKNVYARFSVKTELIVPGYATVSGPDLSSLDELLTRKPSPPPPPRPAPPGNVITLPPALRKFAALKVALADDGAAEQAARWAQRHGFSALFVRASLWDDGEGERIARLVGIGKKHGVRIYPVVSILRVPPVDAAKKESAPHDLGRARNIFGETLREYADRRKDSAALRANKFEADQIAANGDSDWLDASDPAVRTAVSARLTDFAKVPGIAGVIWDNVAAPGMAFVEQNWINGYAAGRYTGFTDALRVAFIRQENADPSDMPPSGNIEPYIEGSGSGESPFQGQEWDLRERFRQHPAYRRDPAGVWKAEKSAGTDYDVAASSWNRLRRESNRSWVGAIRQAVDLPATVPVYLEAPAESSAYNLTPWIAPWAASETLMPTSMGKEPLLPLTVGVKSTPESVRVGLTTQLVQRLGTGKTPAYAGIMIDITARPLAEGLSLLSPLATMPK